MDAPVLAWYFASTDRRMRHGGPWLRAGEAHSFVGELVLGERGFHGCIDPLDALVFGHGPIACRILLGGELIVGPTRICSREIEVVSVANAESVLRSAGMTAVREALPDDLSSVVLDSSVLRDLRRDVETRTEALQDGQWVIEQGGEADLDRLRGELELAQRNATLVDAALRLEEPSFERLRSALEDIRRREVPVVFALDDLEPLETPPDRVALNEPTPQRGLDANMNLLGRALGQLDWIREASIGRRRSDGVAILFVETTSRARSRKAAARRIADVLVRVPTLPVMLLVINRAESFELDVAIEHRFLGDGVRPLGPDTHECDHRRAITLVRPRIVILDPDVATHSPPLLEPPKNDSTWVLDSYFKPRRSEREPEPNFANAADRLNTLRHVREPPPIGCVAIWGARTYEELRAELLPLEMRPALCVHDKGVDRLLVSKARTNAGLHVQAMSARLLPPHLRADVFAPTVLGRIAVERQPGPRHLHLAPFVATSIGRVSGFRVWSDSISPPYPGTYTPLPWVYAVWEIQCDSGRVYEVLRRSTDPDPIEDAFAIRRVFGADIVGFVDSGEWVSVEARERYTFPHEGSRRLTYVLDPDAD